MTARHGTLVLGMHRSGTSMMTGVLTRCGLAGPRTPMAADEWNTSGYGESQLLYQFHERLLDESGTRWDTYHALPLEWLLSEQAGRLRKEARGLLEREFDVTRPFVMKDPRLCRFVPFWLQVLKAAGIQAAAVLVVRHPSEVAGSLAARDGLPDNTSRLLWLRHVLDAERDSRVLPRVVVRYDRTLADWRGAVTKIGTEAQIPLREPERPDDVDRFVDANLRHHVAPPEDPETAQPMVGWLARTWAAMCTLEGEGGEQGQATGELDAVGLELEQATDLFDEERSRLADELARLQADHQTLAEEDERQREALAQLTAKLADAHAHIATLERECAAMRSSMSWRITGPLRALGRLGR